MSSKLIRNLKTLFHDFIFYREDDEMNFHNWISEKVEYTNGNYVNQSTFEQNISVSFAAWIVHPAYRAGDLKITVNPGISGQNVTIVYVKTSDGAQATATLTTNSNGYCYLSDSFFRNYSATITVEPITVNGVTYAGGSVTYNL